MVQHTLSLVIPAFNEAKRIKNTIDLLKEYMRTRSWIKEVLIVVEPSRDQTLKIANEAAQGSEQIHIIANAVHKGKGFAVKTGMLQSTGDWILFCDADLAVSLDQIDSLMERAKEIPKVVIGTRYARGMIYPKHESILRRWLSRLFKMVFLRVVNLDVTDSQCGFKLFDRESAQKIFRPQKINGFAFDVETLLRAYELGIPVEEFPVKWVDPGNSTFSIYRHGLQIMKDILKLRLSRFLPFSLAEWVMPLLMVTVGVFQIWYSMNPHSVDHQGHVTSSLMFWKGYFHSFVDQFFLGYVQNLFYPPLNDFLMGGFLKYSFFSIDTTYQIYLSLCWTALVLSAFRLSLLLPSLQQRLFFQAGAFLLFLNSDTQKLNDQGLSIHDLLVFGLIPQLLTGTLFFLWLFEIFTYWIKDDRKPNQSRVMRLFVLTTLILLGHLVNALVLVFFGVMFWLGLRASRFLFFSICLGSFLIAFFFWGPFLAYRSEIVSASIFNEPRWGAVLFSIFCSLVFLFLKMRRIKVDSSRTLFFLALIPGLLVFPTILSPLRDFYYFDLELPEFHYYRLTQYANWIELLVGAVFFMKLALRIQNIWIKWGTACVLIVCFLLGKNINPTFFYRVQTASKYDVQVLEEQLSVKADSLNRIWTKHLERSIDFVLDSIGARGNSEVRFTKGLFWESSLNNELLGDYLLSLEGEPHVLAGTIFNKLSVFESACLQKMMIEDFAISKILAPTPLTLSNQAAQMPEWVNRNRELNKISIEVLERRTFAKEIGIDYVPENIFNLGSAYYRWYQVLARDLNQTAVVEQISPHVELWELPRDINDRHRAYQEMVKLRCGREGGKRIVLIADKRAEQFLSKTPNPSLVFEPARIKKIERNVYEIVASDLNPAPYLIKLTWSPFWQLITKDGVEAPLFKSWPGMLARWKGVAVLQFKRSQTMWFSYIVSGITLVVCLYLLFAIGRSRRTR